MMIGFRKMSLAAMATLALGGTAMIVGVGAAPSKVVEHEIHGDHWRNFDGHWSYWHEGDKCWYYTDGVHWYTHTAKGWIIYQFDKLFGKTNFHHGEYKPPAAHVNIELPKHKIYEHH